LSSSNLADPLTTPPIATDHTELSDLRVTRNLKRRAISVAIMWTAVATSALVVLGPILVYNATRLVRGPEQLSTVQLANRLTKPIPLDWKIQSLQLPKLPATGTAFGLSQREEAIYDYRYALVGNQLLVTQVEASGTTPTTGELKRLTGTTAEWANKQLAGVGKNVTLAPYLFDTTSNVGEKLRGLVTLITFLLVFSFFGVAYSIRLLKDPLKFKIGDDREFDHEYLSSLDGIAPKLGWHQTAVVNGQLAYRGPYGYKCVAANDVMWMYYRKRFGHVVEVRTTRGQSLAFPLRKASESSELYRLVHEHNPFAYGHPYNDASIAWCLDRRLFGATFLQLQNDPQHREQFQAEDRLHQTVIRAAALTIARSKADRSLLARFRSLFDCRTGAWRKAGASSSIIALATVTLAMAIGGTMRSGRSASSKTWSAEVKPLAAFVERTRGGAFASVVPVDLLDPASYDLIAGNAAPETIDPCPARINPTTAGSSQVEAADLCVDGLAPDLRRITFELLGMQHSKPSSAAAEARKSIGFYSPIDKRLYVRGVSLSNASKTVLVHELTHAWQDQHFDLSQALPMSAESRVAWKALVEGDATFVESAYSATLPHSKNRDTANDDLSTGAEASAYELGLILPAVFPYTAGASYIKHLRESGGAEAVDRKFTDPPLRIAEVLPYAAPHKPIADLTPTALITSFEAPEIYPTQTSADVYAPSDDRSLYSENLDLLSFYALATHDQSIPLRALSSTFEGARIELRAGVGYLCAKLRAQSNFGLWGGNFAASNEVTITHTKNSRDSIDVIQRCVYDLSPGWRSRLKSVRKVGISENADGFSLALKDPESTTDELSRWYIAASFAGNERTTSAADICFADALSAAAEQFLSGDSHSKDLIRRAATECQIPVEVLRDLTL
jgi:hypothetical protein